MSPESARAGDPDSGATDCTDPDPREALAAAIWARAMPADACPGREYLARRV